MADMVELLLGVGRVLAAWIIGTVMVFVPKSWRFKDVSNDIVLITGGGSGIGRLLAKKFAALGSTVVVWDLNQAGLTTTVSQIKALVSFNLYICQV